MNNNKQLRSNRLSQRTILRTHDITGSLSKPVLVPTPMHDWCAALDIIVNIIVIVIFFIIIITYIL